MLCARHLLHVPGLLVFCHGIETRQALAHTGRPDLCHFTSRAQALRKPFENGVVPDRHQRTHRHSCSDLRTPTPGRLGPPQGATVPIAGGDADEGRTALAAQRAPLRPVEPSRPRTPQPHAWDTAVQGLALAPDGARPQRRVQVVSQGCHALIEPGEMGLDVGPQATRRVPEAVLLGGPHGAELPPPRQAGAQLFGLRVWQRARHRPYRLRKVRHGPGLAGSSCGHRPRRVGQVPSRAATTARWYPPVASSLISVGSTAWSRATRAAIPGSSFVPLQRSPVGRRAISSGALATSRPTKHWEGDRTPPD